MSHTQRADGAALLEVQTEMVGGLIALQEQRTAVRRELAQVFDAEQDSKSRHLDEIQRAIRVVKDVANGIAWRALAYDRALIRQMSLKPQNGAVERDSIGLEIAAAHRFLRDEGAIAIINDITDCLRFSDVTVATDNRVRFEEIKGGAASASSGRATRQRTRLRDHIALLQEGFSRRPDGRLQQFVYTDVRAIGHAPTVGQLLRAARRDGSAHARLTDCLNVNVTFPQIAIHDPSHQLQNPFRDVRLAVGSSSLDHFDRWTANTAPLSIYPFDLADRLAVLTGEAVIFSQLNIGNLVRCLRRRGLEVTLPTDAEMQKTQGLRPGEVPLHEFDAPIRISRRNSPFELNMSMLPIGRLIYEYLDESSLADMIEYLLDQAHGASTLYPSFANEPQLWD